MKNVRWVSAFVYRVLFVSPFLIPTSNVRAQFFEGNVTYLFEIRNGDPNTFPDSLFNLMYKDAPVISYTYYYKDNKYKSLTNSDTKRVQIYEPSENRIYSYTEGSEFAFWSEWDNKTTVEKLDKVDTILGIQCSAVILKNSHSETTLYFPSAYRVDTSKFNEFNAWENYLRIAGSIPLKYIIRTNGAAHVIILTASAITEEKMEDDFFRIPKFTQIMKSQF